MAKPPMYVAASGVLRAAGNAPPGYFAVVRLLVRRRAGAFLRTQTGTRACGRGGRRGCFVRISAARCGGFRCVVRAGTGYERFLPAKNGMPLPCGTTSLMRSRSGVMVRNTTYITAVSAGSNSRFLTTLLVR